MDPSTTALLLLATLLAGLVIGAAVSWLARSGQVRAAREEAASARATGASAAQAALEPVGQALTALNRAVAGASRDEAAARAALAEQVRELQVSALRSQASLQRETRRLVGALSRSDVRGRWGEMQLRRLLQTSGLQAGVHYEEQVSLDGSQDGVLRPDVIVRLGADQCLVIDAKVSMAAFLRAEAEDPGPEQEAALVEHAAEVRAHVRRLGAKAYWRHVDQAPDFVVAFLPAEALLAEALARDPFLLEDAFAQQVILATPTTLQALLRTVGHIWRQEAVAENARAIAELGRELHERLGTLAGHFDRLGAALASAVGCYNRAVGSFDTRVLVTARRFADLAGEGAGPASPRVLDVTTRPWPTPDADAAVPTTPRLPDLLSPEDFDPPGQWPAAQRGGVEADPVDA